MKENIVIRGVPPVPLKKFRVLRVLGALFLKVFGWRIEGPAPDLPKCVAIFAYHSSNWDGVFAMALKYVLLDKPAGWIAKDSVYRWPFRTALNWLNMIPVDRNNPDGFVEDIAREFLQRDISILGLAPEGTRGGVGRWKTGFYRIALEAEVPILLVYMDYKEKTMGCGPLIQPSGDFDSDMEFIKEFFDTKTPKHPDKKRVSNESQ